MKAIPFRKMSSPDAGNMRDTNFGQSGSDILRGFLVDTQATCTVNDDVEETTRHYQVLTEMRHIGEIPDR
jgi:hypothetical protein